VAKKPDNSTPLHDIQTEPGFERFVRDTQARLRGFVRSKGLSPQDADDLAQEAYLTLWKRRADAADPKAFLLGIASTLVRAHYRKSVRLDFVSLDQQFRDSPLVEPASPQEVTVRLPTSSLIREGLAGLTRRQREVIELVWLQGTPRPDAAASIGISPSTLRTHEQQALQRILNAAKTRH